jgi:hypothetical protein
MMDMKTFTESSTEAQKAQKDGFGDGYTNVRLFNEIDKHEARCTVSEVGEPWEDRWGIPDLQAGLCIPLALGKRKVQYGFQASQQSAGEQLPEDDQIEDIPGFAFEKEIAAYRANPEAYKAMTPPGVVVKVLAIDEDRRREKLVAETAGQQTPVEMMTTQQLRERLYAQIAAMDGSVPTDAPATFLRVMERGIDLLLGHPTRENADNLLAFVRRSVKNASD